MIRLQHIKTVPLAGGNRIGIQWLNPSPEAYSGVKVVCKELTHPITHIDGRTVKNENQPSEIIPNHYLFYLDVSFSHYLDNAMVSPGLAGAFSTHHYGISQEAVVTVMTPGLKWKITDGEDIYLVVTMGGQLKVYGLASVEDTNLQAETVFYYTLFPCNEGADDYVYHFKNRTSAMAAGAYDFIGLMYGLLPAVYHRYDAFLSSQQKDGKGPLRRFLELPGEQLDQFYSFARAAADLHNLDRVDGRLLPLLAQWIGWETDPDKDIAARRIELRSAPALYKTIGSIPTLETMIKQVTGWENRVKEFKHGLFFSNRPERLYHRAYHRVVTEKEGEQHICWREEEDILSSDYAHGGRPSTVWVHGEEDVLWLFYHSPRKGGWNIWLKTYTLNDGWSPSRPFTQPGPTALDKHPSAVLQGGRLWVFWCAHEPGTYSPRIHYRLRTDGQWSQDQIFAPGGDQNLRRKNPAAVVDHSHRLWLFWLEESSLPGLRWELKYNRHNGVDWESTTSLDFPLDGQYDPCVDNGLFVLVHPLQAGESGNRLTLLWSRKRRRESGGKGHMRLLSQKEIAFRHKTGGTALDEGWGQVFILPKDNAAGFYDDCEPAALCDAGGDVHLCWSTNRGGNWSIRHITAPGLFELSAQVFSSIVVAAGPVIDNLYSQRTPLPVMLSGQANLVTVLYRSSRGPTGENATPTRMARLDFLSAGSVSVDDRTPIRLGKRNEYGDLLNYTYDTGLPGPDNGPRLLGSNNRYTHDSVGLFIEPTWADQHLINRNQELILGILDRFVPILARVLFIIDSPPFSEFVYPYDKDGTQVDIRDDSADTLAQTFPADVYPGQLTDSVDRASLDWVWLESWSDEYGAYQSVDTRADPVNTRYRSMHFGVAPVIETGMFVGSVPEKYPEIRESISDSVDYFRMDSWSDAHPDHLSVDTWAVSINKNHRTLHTGLNYDTDNNMRVWDLPDYYDGVSDDIIDAVTGGNETRTWRPGATEFSYTVDFSGAPPENTLRSWHKDYT